MKSMTPSQQEAIAARGNVLVSAGAGTGKTRTLVERCLRLILEEGVSLENILLVTFTEAAAAEMRERIRGELLRRLGESPQNTPGSTRLGQELALLDTAPISTLHGFCLSLVRQHFHALDLDPQVAVLDDSQTQPLIQQTFQALFASCYALAGAQGEAIRDLIGGYGGSEEILRRLILRIHRYAQSLADPAGWWRSQVALFDQPAPVQWRQWRVEGFVEWRDLWLPALRPLASQAPNVAACVQALEESVPSLPNTPALSAAEPPAALAVVAKAVAAVCAANAAPWVKGTKGRVRDPIKAFFEEAAFLGSLTSPAEEGHDPLAEDWEWARHPMLSLLGLARDFGERFAQAKRELGGVDFSDIEQLALRLLWDRQAGEPTPVAREWQRRFEFVFVDEYQDINAAQDTILRALSRDGAGANRFLVGDVKQSIYRFRLAAPRIFRGYEQSWRSDSSQGRYIPLSENFRSREGILEFVNGLFTGLMRTGVGGVEYDEDARLRFGDAEERAGLRHGAEAADPAAAVTEAAWGGSHRVELHLVSSAQAGGEPGDGEEHDGEPSAAQAEALDLAATEREARLIALRLRQLKESGHLVWDRDQGRCRPAEWSDMAVLLRSAKGRGECFAKEFSGLGVPLLAERGGFYTSAEILDLLSLLRVLDNPLQDVPLLAVLRSPLVGLAIRELADLRLGVKKTLFWAALNHWRHAHEATGRTGADDEETSLFSKVDTFLARFKEWRRTAREGSLSECLEVVLADTQYEALLQAQERGNERLANVRRFLWLARAFDPYQRQGLFRFLRFVDAQEQTGVEEEAAPLPTRNAVRLMTIHRSKGLEFPVVVLAGLGTPFNFQDAQDRVLLSEAYGLCPRVQMPETEQTYPSIAHWLARRHDRREALGEELRLLYVAMTRARDTLILVGTAGSKAGGEPWPAEPAQRPADRELIKALRPLDWLRLWLPHVTQTGDWDSETTGGNDLLRWAIYPKDDARFAARPPAPVAVGAGPPEGDPAELRALEERLLWTYPFQAAVAEPAKASVSALRGRALGDDEAVVPRFVALAAGSSRAVRSDPGAGLSAAARGTAHHLFQQQVDLDRVASEIELRNEAHRMLSQGLMSAEEAAALDFGNLLAFWHSDLGRRIRAQPREYVHRELPFTVRLSAEDLEQAGVGLVSQAQPQELAGEFVVVQGTADLAVILPAEIWLVDFKTDQVKADELAEKALFYGPQLELYARALERIDHRPGGQRWLHFFAVGRSVELTPKV